MFKKILSFHQIKIIALVFMAISLLMEVCQAQELNDLMTNLNKTTNPIEKIILLKKIGAFYQNQKAYNKSIDYFTQALNLQIANNDSESYILQTRAEIAYAYTQIESFDQAIGQYELILARQQQSNNPNAQLSSLNYLTALYRVKKDYPQALAISNKILQINQSQNNQLGMIEAYNNLGYLHKENGDKNKSLEYYQKALTISRQYSQSVNNANSKAILLTNTGVTYSYLRDFKIANQYFNDAFVLYQKQGNKSQQAHSLNYIAANHYISNKNDLAISNALKSVDIALPINDGKALLESYQILAEAYQQDGDFKESQKYLRLLQDLKDKLSEKERLAKQALLEEQINIEKKENELKSLIAEKEKQAADLRQSELERQRQEQDLKLKENELALLKRNQEMQQEQLKRELAEKRNAEQLLEITKQKAIADQERLLAETRKGEADRQKLLADKERIEREKEQKARQVSEQAQEAQKKQLESEKSLRQYSYLIIGLIAAILLLVGVGLMNARKTAQRLKAQNHQIIEQNNEIESQNEELFQNQEEILAQRDFIEQKNKELEEYNRQVRSSINAAMLIQQAILPYQAKLDKIFGEYLLIFRPKDGVSGDFFWLNEIDNLKILVVADCTGHGVPGAFMTLIANNLLDKIIRVWKITQPSEILAKLHEEVTIVLRQKETENYNGMDANIITWTDNLDNQLLVNWAGAKQDIFLLKPQTETLETIKGSRRAIGGIQNERIIFENHTWVVERGTKVYVGTDGLPDQNDVNRKRLSEKKLKQFIESQHQQSFATQQNLLEEILDNHMQGTSQRDDILWLGFEL
ncbi:MAG: tetratricopeptide repeat protein [Microscillaceae bacterium]|jgi:serine phosphatase RsbU (regulator of sigma subunit)/tetratricopeptide (TPR) repeat protein|nr:tetratricopeptide repeat protein [Microscillaceae bacterium]